MTLKLAEKVNEKALPNLAEKIAAMKEKYAYVGWSTSMADAMDKVTAAELDEKYNDLALMFMDVATNILWASEDEVPNRGTALVSAANELATLLGDVSVDTVEAEVEAEPEEIIEEMAEATKYEPTTVADLGIVTSPDIEELPVEESVTEDVIPTILLEQGASILPKQFAERGSLLEAVDVGGEENRRGPLRLRVGLITAGPGNKRDNHWYPQGALEAAAPLFAGAKMFQTQHVDEERTTRNEASIVEQVIGYDPEHGLVADVLSYDPDFCEKVRNRRDAGRLDTLQCSIYAGGTAQKGTINGEAYQIVQSIDQVVSVDWVAWGAAGGHVVEAEEIGMLEREKVTELLAHTLLPEAFQAVLAESTYTDEESVNASVTAMADALAKFVPSVKDNPPTEPEPVISEAIVNERVMGVNQKFLGS